MINLTIKLNEIGKKIVQELSFNIKNQIQLNGSSIFPVAQSTRLARLKKGYSNITRLLLTGNLWKNAFKFVVQNNKLSLFVSNAIHPDGIISYNDIIAYNDVSSSEVNQNVIASNRPKVFPMNEIDLNNIKSYQFGLKELELETKRQIEQELKNKIPQTIKVNVNI